VRWFVVPLFVSGGVELKEFKDKVAVITGAASGIGFGLAEHAAKEGMKVVLADIEEDALEQAQKQLKEMGVETLAVKTDVSKAEDVEALAEKTISAFGAVHLLCNNAGVGAGNEAWCSLLDWKWVLGVNLWGVIHGVHFFVPIMLKQDTECNIVNTSSMAGLVSQAGNAPYHVSKHGVVALSENLYLLLKQMNSKIGVSVICPGFINTNIMDCDRNRPAELEKESEEPLSQEMMETVRKLCADGMPPSELAEIVFNAIKESQFYIYPNAESFMDAVRTRAENVMLGRNPSIANPT
jgi:NAD(P)-dependent dehydrogenase (short-subunit alcohol dehydrogenase family)